MAKKEISKKGIIKAHLISDKVLTEPSDESLELYNQSRFGAVPENKKLQLSLIEALYLVEKEKITVYFGNKELTFEQLMKKAEKKEPNVWTRFVVFKDLRNRGYVVKTALKFGADFRVYERGVKPGEDHAKWIVYPVEEEASSTWYEFAAKTRVAHSTKKRLLIGIVDNEGDVTYYEIKWTRP
ncbi:tRNA-intron lyase [Candidatus Woesearchaeota archaeon]|nr:tRNA-intron lyase [Candidatus Woesearchaeota archaeon]